MADDNVGASSSADTPIQNEAGGHTRQGGQPAGEERRKSTRSGFKRHGSRYKARRRAVDILFEAEFRDQDPVYVVEQRRKLSQDPESGVLPVSDYTATIVSGVAENLDGIDSAIASHLSSTWRLDRIPAVDRAVMRVSTWELLHNEEVPPKVAVSEGIELASEYSTDVAPAYVNAVLDDIAGEVQRSQSNDES